ncbi:Cupin-like domain-containing protein [Polaromonas sp. OV174]|uniref:cupin-like domain-containing protein n=1 Tax=Polaromonas sp. OV174 TaxID=1855300 RepID=UPI0008EB70FC|nr:cupin-like domain-containing protein [Polaromonas sp. OV174]SFC46434.1 Cupin-like domain-containing protein [Polaromonas sp. OV174]
MSMSAQALFERPIEAELVAAPPAQAPIGPSFELIEETTWEALKQSGRQWPFARPVLIKGGIKHWPAFEKWSFEHLAGICEGQGAEAPVKFTDGLVEQGLTKGRPFLPVAPYLRELGKAAQKAPSPAAGLLPKARQQALRQGQTGARFHLNWAHMQSFRPTTLYLAQWDILEKFPQLRQDLLIKSLWPGQRMTWEYVFMGPANTVTGLHNDFPHNWFCQLTGTKEFLLFPPDQSEHMCPAKKYDWGATLSDINVSRLPSQAKELASFEKAHGIYARVEAGDALFVPKRTWHSVVSLEPSISLGMFGLTPYEVATGGAWATLRDWAHHLHLHAWGNCTCHQVLGKR